MVAENDYHQISLLSHLCKTHDRPIRAYLAPQLSESNSDSWRRVGTNRTYPRFAGLDPSSTSLLSVAIYTKWVVIVFPSGLEMKIPELLNDGNSISGYFTF